MHLSYALALTKGTLANPTAKDNDGAQLVGRLGLQPAMGLKLGLSGAYGLYMNDGIERARDFPTGQTAESFNRIIFGVDLEYTRGLIELYAEAVRNEWEVPNLEENSLGSTGGYIEGRYTFYPGAYWALRYGRLGFDKIAAGQGGKEPWDYTVQRVETGLGYYLDRNVRLKLVTQLNFKEDFPGKKEEHLVSVQVASTF